MNKTYLLSLLLASFLLLGAGLGAGPASAEGPSGVGDGIALEQVNINTAGVEALAEVLKGVGLSKAQEIVNHRQAFGDFKSALDLAQVRGIGERIVLANENKIILSD